MNKFLLTIVFLFLIATITDNCIFLGFDRYGNRCEGNLVYRPTALKIIQRFINAAPDNKSFYRIITRANIAIEKYNLRGEVI